MRAPIDTVTVTDTPERLAALDMAAVDVQGAGVIAELVVGEGEAFAVAVTLSDEA
jgi:hypothetical protein